MWTKLRSLPRTLRFIWTHPFAGQHKWKALGAYANWQIVSRCVRGGAAVMPFTANSQLYATSDLHGATGNLYLGLHEFSEMSFLLHFLRAEDLFFDIGANVGSYTVLASAEVGSSVVACEPVPATSAILKKNIALNECCDIASVIEKAAGESEGAVEITGGLDAQNHVVSGRDQKDILKDEATIQVDVTTLDQLAESRVPNLIKIDVEGFEKHVLDGASVVLNDASLKAIIIEMSDFSMEDSHRLLTDAGFEPFRYLPFKRHLDGPIQLDASSNVIYVRATEVDFVKHRLSESRPIDLGWQSI